MSEELELARVQVAEWKAAYEQVAAERDALSWRVMDFSEAELRGLRAFAREVERVGDPVVARMAGEALLGRFPERRAA